MYNVYILLQHSAEMGNVMQLRDPVYFLCNVFVFFNSGNADNAKCPYVALWTALWQNAVLCESRLLEVPVFINLSIVLASHYLQHMNIYIHNNILRQTIVI